MFINKTPSLFIFIFTLSCVRIYFRTMQYVVVVKVGFIIRPQFKNPKYQVNTNYDNNAASQIYILSKKPKYQDKLVAQ